METVASPHHGRYLLGLSIISIFVAMFGMPLGILAWYRAQSDLAAMSAGRMDASGRALTQWARGLAVVATVLVAIAIVVVVIALAVPGTIEATRVTEIGR